RSITVAFLYFSKKSTTILAAATRAIEVAATTHEAGKSGWRAASSISSERATPATLRFEITDATGLLADSIFKRFLRRGHFGARLGEIVGKADDLAFVGLCDRIVGALADRIVRRNLQLSDVSANHNGALVRGDIPVRHTKTVDVQIAVAEVVVMLVVEGFKRGGLIGLKSRDGPLEHRPPICGRSELRFRKRCRAPG